MSDIESELLALVDSHLLTFLTNVKKKYDSDPAIVAHALWLLGGAALNTRNYWLPTAKPSENLQ